MGQKRKRSGQNSQFPKSFAEKRRLLRLHLLCINYNIKSSWGVEVYLMKEFLNIYTAMYSNWNCSSGQYL